MRLLIVALLLSLWAKVVLIDANLSPRGYGYEPQKGSNIWHDFDRSMGIVDDDDPRHGDGPNTYEAEDLETNVEFTATPSSAPPGTPSKSPSTSPSLHPSSSPTISAFVFPSTSPSPDPCKSHNGVYGDTSTDDNAITIIFLYRIEMDMDVMDSLKAPLSDLTSEIENDLLHLLIRRFSGACNDLGNGHGIIGELQLVSSGVISAEDQGPKVVGIKSDPGHLANGDSCSSNIADDNDGRNITCSWIDGGVTMYLSDSTKAANITQQVLESINTSMDAQLLDDSHPAISRVIFINFQEQLIGIPKDRRTYYGWMIALFCIIGGVTFLVLLRNKCSKRKKDEGDANVETNVGGFGDITTFV